MALPIFDRNQGNILRTHALVTEARRNVDHVRFSLQSRLAEAFRRYGIALNQVQQYRDQILPDAKASLDLVRTGYQAGEFDYLGLLTVQQTYFQTNLACLDSLLQLKTAESLIEGMLLSGSLQAQELPAPREAETLTPGVQSQSDFITELSPSP